MRKIYGVSNYEAGLLPRIEDVLSLLDLYSHERSSLTRELRYEDILKIKNDLLYLMCVVFAKKLAPDQCPNISVMRDFVEKLNVIENPRLSLISTNYDIVLDNELFSVEDYNYGIIVRHVLERRDSLRRGEEEIWIGVGGSEIYYRGYYNGGPVASSQFNRGKIPLYKLHGSLNWLWCPRCQELDITVFEKGALRTQHRNYLCASEGGVPACTSPYETLIVTPTMFKIYDNRILKETWVRAEQSVLRSKLLIFIGYSLQDADIHIRCMLTRAIANSEARPKILVVDFLDLEGDDEDERRNKLRLVEDTEKRYKCLFGEEIEFERYGFGHFVSNMDAILNSLL